MKNNVIETIIGAVVLLVAAGFLVFAYQGSGMEVESGSGYTLKAKFANATGVNVGSDVRIGGIKIGVVSGMSLDPETYQAILAMHVAEGTAIPSDSSAAISSAGLLSEKFVQVTPGGEENMLKDGGEIEYTQSSVSLEDLIGKFVFSGGGVDKGEKSTAKP